MRHCRSVSSTDVLWVHQLVLAPQAFGSSVRSGNVRVSLFVLQFLCSIGEPFLRADLAPQGRRTEPRSRLAKASAGGGMVLGGEHGARLVGSGRRSRCGRSPDGVAPHDHPGRLVDHDDERDPARARDVHYFIVDP